MKHNTRSPAEIQRLFEVKLREVKRLKAEISAMRQKAYFDRKFAHPKDYHGTEMAHRTAVVELKQLRIELNQCNAATKVANEPFNIRFIRAARLILDPATFEQVAAAAESMGATP